MPLGFCPQPQVGSSTPSKTSPLGGCCGSQGEGGGRAAMPSQMPPPPFSSGCEHLELPKGGGQRPSSEAARKAAGAQATLCSSPCSPHGGQHPRLCLPWPTAEPLSSPHPGPPQCSPAGGCVATPAAGLCPPGSHLSTWTGKALGERSDLSLQRGTLDFILPSRASPTPSQTASLLPGLAPCQVNTAGVSSPCSPCQGTHQHPPLRPSIPWGQPGGLRSTEAGPAPQDCPRGSSVVPVAALPCCEHPPCHLPYKPATCTTAGPRSPSPGGWLWAPPAPGAP